MSLAPDLPGREELPSVLSLSLGVEWRSEIGSLIDGPVTSLLHSSSPEIEEGVLYIFQYLSGRSFHEKLMTGIR